MNRKRLFKLLKELPMLSKDTVFVFYDSTSYVHWIFNGRETEYPIRQGLAGYLWLLLTEDGYFEHIETTYE